EYMPRAKAGANLYEVESEFWSRGGWVQRAESSELLINRLIKDRTTTSPGRRRDRFESSRIAELSDAEFEGLLPALAKKHLRPEALSSDGPMLHANVESLLSTRRLLSVVCERPEYAQLYQALGREIEAAPASHVINTLRDLGILDALEEAPQLLFTNLRRSAIPTDDLRIFRRSSIEDPEAEMALLLYHARDFASAGQSPSETLEQAAEVLRRKGEQMKTGQDMAAPLKRRKLLNGIGNLLMGLATAGGNA